MEVHSATCPGQHLAATLHVRCCAFGHRSSNPCFMRACRIKERFSDRADIYKTFLEILHRYKEEAYPIAKVREEVAVLFHGHDDLLKEFRHFLPGVCFTEACQLGRSCELESIHGLGLLFFFTIFRINVSHCFNCPLFSCRQGSANDAQHETSCGESERQGGRWGTILSSRHFTLLLTDFLFT